MPFWSKSRTSRSEEAKQHLSWDEDLSRDDFFALRKLTRGTANPEQILNPYREIMVRRRNDSYWVDQLFEVDDELSRNDPTWGFLRYGQSRTLLPRDAIAFIGGWQEESFRSKSLFHNDVVIVGWDGEIKIYDYPIQDFEPVAYHTATYYDSDAYGEQIMIIGGYGADDLVIGTTPVYRLDLGTKRIVRVSVLGDEPGAIYGHQAAYVSDLYSIVVWDGQIQTSTQSKTSNRDYWAFRLDSFTWDRLEIQNLAKN